MLCCHIHAVVFQWCHHIKAYLKGYWPNIWVYQRKVYLSKPLLEMEFGKFLPFAFATMCTHCPISIAVFHVNVFTRVILNKILSGCLISYTGCKFNWFFFDLIRILRDNGSSLYLRADYQDILYIKKYQLV